MSGEITEITLTSGDITQVTIGSLDLTTIIIQTSDTTVLTAAPATINAASLNYSDSIPANIARIASAGVALTVSRSDHTHSAADLLVDGGNY